MNKHNVHNKLTVNMIINIKLTNRAIPRISLRRRIFLEILINLSVIIINIIVDTIFTGNDISMDFLSK